MPVAAHSSQLPRVVIHVALRAPAGSLRHALSCADLAAERSATASKLEALKSQRNSAATGDAIGVFLLGVPVSSLAGGDKSGEIATAKGQLLAIDAQVPLCRPAKDKRA